MALQSPFLLAVLLFSMFSYILGLKFLKYLRILYFGYAVRCLGQAYEWAMFSLCAM